MKLAKPQFNLYSKLHQTGFLGVLMGVFMIGLAAIFGLLWAPGLAQAQEPDASGITVILVVDDSKSMNETDPEQRRGLGGRLLIERLFPEDQIATVLFSRQARVVGPLSEVRDDENRNSLKSSLSLLQSSGSTDMLDALTEAFRELERDKTDDPKLVVFLTDGRLLQSEVESSEYMSAFEDLLKAYRTNEWPVFPISFGLAADAVFMSTIAEVTGGETCDAPTDSELAACFQTVLDKFKETERVLSVTPLCLQMGESADYTVYVDPYANQLSVVTAQENILSQTIVLNPSRVSSNATRQEGIFRFYNFDNPAEGTWTVRFTGPGCFGESFAYIQSDIRVALESPGRVHGVKPSMDIQATIKGHRGNTTGTSIDGHWQSIPGRLTLSAASPEGRITQVALAGQKLDHVGQLDNATQVGDYRLMFEVTLAFNDPLTGLLQERVYLRQHRVEVVEAPELETSIVGETVHRIIPGESININGQIAPYQGLRSPVMSASIGDQELQIELAPNGAFSGTVIPHSAGSHTLKISLESTLIGRYGEVRYPSTSEQTIVVEFDPMEIVLTLVSPQADLNHGQSASLVGLILSNEHAVEIDQSALSLRLSAPNRHQIAVGLSASDVSGEYHGAFVPKESGVYTLSEIETTLSRNGIPFSADTGQTLGITLNPALNVDTSSISLGKVYHGEVVTLTLPISNNSNQDISLTTQAGTDDLSVEILSPVIKARAYKQPVQVQFQVGLDSSISDVPVDTHLSLYPGSDPALLIPLTYEIGDFFVGLKDKNNDLGFLGKNDRTIPVQLALGYNAPVPVKVSAMVSDSTGDTIIDISQQSNPPLLLYGEGDETITLFVPVPENTPPGIYQGSIHIVSDPPMPVRPTGESTFSYRLPSSLERWVLDSWWWALSVTVLVLLISLTGWGRLVTERISIQGRLLIYDREGMAQLRRVDLRRFGRPIVTVGTRADISLRDSSGLIDQEHAQIVATRGMDYPKIYPMGAAQVVGQFGQNVNNAGVILGDGDTFSIGRYNLEWSATWSNTRLGRLLGDPWWKLGFLAAMAAVGLVLAGFYLVLL